MLTNTEVLAGRQGSRTLVVLVHGWWASLPLFSIADAREAVRDELPDADILEPKYRSHIAANTDPAVVAAELADAIEDACTQRLEDSGVEYENVILVGFSLGSLIVRKALVIGLTGRAVEGPAGTVRRLYGWPAKTSRIVLLAGINNGWSLSPKPRRFSWLLYFLYRLAYPFSFILPAGRLIRSFRRGQPFVENLRIEWHFLGREHPLPPVIQLTGTEEDVVTTEDMIDIRFCRDFIFLHVPHTGHMNAANFHDGKIGRQRRKQFVEALQRPLEALRAESDFAPDPDAGAAVDATVTDIVFLIHGIRDFGEWTHKLGQSIERIAKNNHQKVVVVRPAYERFPLLGFLLTSERRIKVRWFIDQYTQAIARYPRARVHFIGHSNGTYLLARSLELFPACRFENVVFTGSVVRRSFPWDRYVSKSRVARLRNDMAGDDFVVAVFPRFFEQVEETIRVQLSDIGSGGVYGFHDNSGKQFEVRFRGGHGAALREANHDSLARFVLSIDEQPQVDPTLVTFAKVPAATSWASALCWLVWGVLALLPIAASVLVTWLWFKICPDVLSATKGMELAFTEWCWENTAPPFAPIVLPALVCGVVVWWLLKTV